MNGLEYTNKKTLNHKRQQTNITDYQLEDEPSKTMQCKWTIKKKEKPQLTTK
jgi:hypothetical protein